MARAYGEALAAMEAAGRTSGAAPSRSAPASDKLHGEDGESSDGGGGADGSGAATNTERGRDRNHPLVTSFQITVIINHIFAQLQGHAFYLESPCSNVTTGVDEVLWDRSLSKALRKSRRGAYTPKHRKYLRSATTCAALSRMHPLGPFPPRPAAWSKLAAIRHVARRHAFVLYLDSDAFVTRVWEPIEPLISLLGLQNGATWLAAAGEYPPQKLRRDTRAGVSNTGVLLMAGLPTAGPGILRLLEDWIWPARGVPLATFTWPFEQNAFTQSIIRAARYSGRVRLLRPGCPLNSPFGAYIRHLVGGTPDRSVYHHDNRAAWLLESLRCTVALVTAAANKSASETPGRTIGSADEVLRRPEGCATNEPRLVLGLGASCGLAHNFSSPESGILRGERPVGGRALARLGASWWRACCAFCVLHEPCRAWHYHDSWPADSLNCILLDGFRSTARGEKGSFAGRIAGKMRQPSVGPGGTTKSFSRWGPGGIISIDGVAVKGRFPTSGGSTAATHIQDEPIVTYAVPTVGPWDAR